MNRLEAALALAVEHERGGRYGAAVKVLQGALAEGGSGEALAASLARNLAQLRRFEEAAAYYREALAHRPDDSACMLGLAECLQYLQRHSDEVEALYRAAAALAPQDLSIRIRLGHALMRAGRGREAVQEFEALLEQRPGMPEALLALAQHHERSNDTAAARSAVDAIDGPVRSHPDVVLMRARIASREGAHADALRELDALDPSALPDNLRPQFLFQRGHLLDALGETDAAFAAFNAANDAWAPLEREQRAVAGFADEVRENITLLEDDLWLDTWTRLPDSVDDGLPAPVFLVGFPRSGTTLIDAVLEAHPGIQVLEERPVLQGLVESLAADADGDWMLALAEMDASRRRELRAQYWSHAERLGVNPGAGLLIDKLPLASARVHLITRVFPEARFLLAMRHPCDVVLSCFMQDFGMNPAMADFGSLAGITELYTRVFDLWSEGQRRFAPRHHVVRYEDMVEDLESAVRAVLAFLELQWDPKVLEYRARVAARKVDTPSYAQVSRPIYTDAKLRWQRYADHLAEVSGRLAPYAVRAGYADPSQGRAR